jgi:hypothetical protein
MNRNTTETKISASLVVYRPDFNVLGLTFGNGNLKLTPRGNVKMTHPGLG